MTHIVYEKLDGSVAIATVAENVDDIDDVVRKFREAHPGEYPTFTVHKKLTVPESREYRDAWVWQKGKIIVDEKKAEKIRLEREKSV